MSRRNDETALLRIGELSQSLGIPAWTLRRWADEGRIPFTLTAGGQRRFYARHVRQALGIPQEVAREVPSFIPVGFTPVTPTEPPSWERSYSLDGLQEHLVWQDLQAHVLLDVDSPATRIIEYSVEEMVNNAVDHSGGTTVTVRLWALPDIFVFAVIDDGEGALRHLREGLGLADDFDAILALSKGRQTTARARHTGEGIFFTSKMNDIFRLTANGKSWTVDNIRQDQSVGLVPLTRGTSVVGQLDRATSRTAREVFRSFTDENFNFSHTRPSVKLAALGLRFASRSEARRLMNDLGEFTAIDLDFTGVPEVGQGFVDEVFRVWASDHPDKTVAPINMNEAVEFMVRRGLTRD